MTARKHSKKVSGEIDHQLVIQVVYAGLVADGAGLVGSVVAPAVDQRSKVGLKVPLVLYP